MSRATKSQYKVKNVLPFLKFVKRTKFQAHTMRESQVIRLKKSKLIIRSKFVVGSKFSCSTVFSRSRHFIETTTTDGFPPHAVPILSKVLMIYRKRRLMHFDFP